MFQAEIHFLDIMAPVSIADGAICFGGSFVRPFSHRLLNAICAESSNFLVIQCYERLADEDSASLQKINISDSEVELLVDGLKNRILDWSLIVVDKLRSRVLYCTSLIHSAPVYVRLDKDCLKVDWDYNRLLSNEAVGINWEYALPHLAGFARYSPHTMVTGLYRSVAGATLVATPSGVMTKPSSTVSRLGPQRLRGAPHPEELLYNTLKALIECRPTVAAKTGAEISGGMDSGLIALAAADVLGPGVFSCGAQFEGAMGVAQRARRRLVCDAGGFDDLELPAIRFAPFGPTSLRRRRNGVWPQDENYPEIFETIFPILAEAGVDTLLSGLGGDELYAAYVGEEPDEPDLLDIPEHPFLTNEGWRRAKRFGHETEVKVLQITSWLSTAGRSQRLLRHGIWPIYPYNSPELASFVGKLPWEHRKDRMLLKRALTKRLDNPVFEQSYVKESFLGVAIRGLEENKSYLETMLGDSRLMNPKFVAVDRIRDALSSDVRGLSQLTFGLLYLALSSACFFQ